MYNTGIDLGLSTTAIVTLKDKTIVHQDSFGTETDKMFKEKMHQADRHLMYLSAIESYFYSNNIQGTVVMEDPMGSFGGNAIKIAEMKGYYLTFLATYMDTSKLYLPKATRIKKAFTGKGNASKEDIILECKKRGYNPQSSHEADCLAMALIAADNCL